MRVNLVCNSCNRYDNWIGKEEGNNTHMICGCGSVEYLDWCRVEFEHEPAKVEVK